MDRRRAAALAKIGILVGVPVAIVCSLFGFGMHVGFKYERSIKGFERDVLGMDVEVPPAGAVAAAVALTAPEPKPDATEGSADGETGADAPEARTPEPKQEPEPTTPEPTTPEPTPEPTTPSAETQAIAFVAATVPPEQQARFDRTRVIRVKAFVDSATVAANPDWIVEVARALDDTRAGWRTLFGIELRLVGVTEWEVPVDLDLAAAAADLATRQREGAALAIGFSGRRFTPEPGPGHGIAHGSGDGATLPGAVVVPSGDAVGAIDPVRVMHALGHAFGAADETVDDDAAASSWSFMRTDERDPDQSIGAGAATVDAVLTHKDGRIDETRAAEETEGDDG